MCTVPLYEAPHVKKNDNDGHLNNRGPVVNYFEEIPSTRFNSLALCEIEGDLTELAL